MEERTRSSIYATAQTVIWPWTDPGVAASARSPKGKHSRGAALGHRSPVAVVGSEHRLPVLADRGPARLAPAFGGLLNDLINQAYRHVAATGKPLDPPLLVVIDEAGNTPLRSLPEYASTLAGIGVLLVTIWQSLAQLEVAYGKAVRHDPHQPPDEGVLRRAVGPGVDSATSTAVLGEAEVDTRSHSAAERLSGGSDQFSTTRVPLAPAHVLRQMRPVTRCWCTAPCRRRTSAPGPSTGARTSRSGPRWAWWREAAVKPFLRATDRARLAPVGWVSEPAGVWAGREVEVVFDPRQHQIVMVRNEPGDTTARSWRPRGSGASQSTAAGDVGPRPSCERVQQHRRSRRRSDATPLAASVEGRGL
jgi:hypothetical protein